VICCQEFALTRQNESTGVHAFRSVPKKSAFATLIIPETTLLRRAASDKNPAHGLVDLGNTLPHAGPLADSLLGGFQMPAQQSGSNGATLVYPNPTGPGATNITEAWVLDNFNNDPFAMNAMIDTAENVATRYQITMAEQYDVVLRRYQQYRMAVCTENLIRVDEVRESPNLRR
jgi:hypothetical protein